MLGSACLRVVQGAINIGAQPASPDGAGREAAASTLVDPLQGPSCEVPLRDGCSLDFSDLEASFDALLAPRRSMPSPKGRATARNPKKGLDVLPQKRDEGRSLSKDSQTADAVGCCRWDNARLETSLAAFEIIATAEPDKAAESSGKEGVELAHVERLIADYEAGGNDSSQVGPWVCL